MAKAERCRQDIVTKAGIGQRRAFELPVRRDEPDDLAPADVEAPGGGGAELDPVMPGELGDRVRILQQPWPVGAAAVVQERMGIGGKDELTVSIEYREPGGERRRPARCRRRRSTGRLGTRPGLRRLGLRRLVEPAARQRIDPEALEVSGGPRS